MRLHTRLRPADSDRTPSPIRRTVTSFVIAGSAIVFAASVAPTAAAEPAAPTSPQESAPDTSEQAPKADRAPAPAPTDPGRYLAGDALGRYIVVLGARMEPAGNPPPILAQRLDRAAALAKSNPLNRVIVTGGNSWWLPVPESMFMHLQLIKRGVNPLQIVQEPTADSTVANAQRSVAMLKAMNASGAVIVTNGFHMKRALKNFRDEASRLGGNLTFVPAYAG